MLGACSRATSSLLHPVQNAREFVTGGWGHECKDHCGQGEGGVAEEGAILSQVREASDVQLANIL